MVGRARLKGAKHIIGGQVIEESSGTSPPGDPLDEDGGASSSKPSTSTAASRRESLERHSKHKHSPKKVIPDREVSEHETDSDSNDEQINKRPKTESDDENNDEEDDAESHASESSGSTGLDESVTKGSEKKKVISSRDCQLCGSSFTPKDLRGSIRYCSKLCAKNASAAQVASKKREALVKKRPAKTETATLSPPATHSTPRTSDRLRRNPRVRQYYSYSNQDGNSSSENESEQQSSKSRKSSTVSSIPSVKREAIMTNNAFPDSPEIESPTIKSKARGDNRASTSKSDGLRSSSKRSLDSDSGRNEDGKESRHFMQMAKSYFNEKPSYIKTLVESKPFHLWDFSEVAQFISVIPGLEDVAVTVLKEQLDGECLVFYDIQTWKAFDLKMGPALKIVREVQTLKEIQRKCTLRHWYVENSRKVEAEMERLMRMAG